MKTLIIYFSISGNTKWLAKQIAAHLPGETDLHRIELSSNKIWKGAVGMFLYGMKTIFGMKMDIQADHINWSEYNHVIIGGPVWVASVPPPLRAFVKKHKEQIAQKTVSVFCTCGGNRGSFFKQLRDVLGVKFWPDPLTLVEPFQHPKDTNDLRVKAFTQEINAAKQQRA